MIRKWIRRWGLALAAAGVLAAGTYSSFKNSNDGIIVGTVGERDPMLAKAVGFKYELDLTETYTSVDNEGNLVEIKDGNFYRYEVKIDRKWPYQRLEIKEYRNSQWPVDIKEFYDCDIDGYVDDVISDHGCIDTTVRGDGRRIDFLYSEEGSYDNVDAERDLEFYTRRLEFFKRVNHIDEKIEDFVGE